MPPVIAIAQIRFGAFTGLAPSLVAEAIFFALRHYATLGWSLQPAAPGSLKCQQTYRGGKREDANQDH